MDIVFRMLIPAMLAIIIGISELEGGNRKKGDKTYSAEMNQGVKGDCH